MNNLLKVWKNKGKILEGIKNSLFKTEHIEDLAQERITICRQNTCGYYDVFGESEKVIVKGVESCGACGCKLSYAVRALSKTCGLEELGKVPLWKAMMTQEEEDYLQKKTGIKNRG